MAWSNLSSNQAVSFADAQTSGFSLKEGQSHGTSSRCMTKSEILVKYNVDIGTTYANPYADNQLVPVVDWLDAGPGYCPSLSDLSSITRNFVGSGGYGTWYFTFTYTGTTTATATIWYRTRRDGIYTPNQFYPPLRYTATFTPGSTHTFSAGYTESPGTYLEVEAFECNETIIAPYEYFVNYEPEQGTTEGYITACAYGPATYPVYANVSSLSAIGAGTIIYQSKYGYPYYSGGEDRWLAIGATEDGSVTYGLELDPDAVVIQSVDCSYTPPVYYNTQQSGTATRNNCPSGYTAGNATLIIPANTYSSSISVADANNQAVAYINANKQAYANANGSCTAPPAYYNLYWYNTNKPFSSNYLQIDVNGVNVIYNHNVSSQPQGGTISIQAGSQVYIEGHASYPPSNYATVTTTAEWVGTLLSETDGPSAVPENIITFTMPEAEVTVNNTMTTVPVYLNTQQSGTATRNNCSEGYTGSDVTLTVSSSTYSSYISVADANSQAVAYINANKQDYANTNGTCTAPTVYYNTEQQLTLAKNDCSEGYSGSDVTLTVAANTYSSYVSVAVANQLAIDYLYDNAQAYANANGTCTLNTPADNVTAYITFAPTGGSCTINKNGIRQIRTTSGTSFTFLAAPGDEISIIIVSPLGQGRTSIIDVYNSGYVGGDTGTVSATFTFTVVAGSGTYEIFADAYNQE